MKKKGPDMAAEAHGEETGGLAFHPMDQFIVKPFFGDGAVSWYTITNATVWMAVAVLAIFALLVLGTSKRSVIPSRMQSVAELAYGFIYKMVEDICGKEGVKYFPYIMTLFMFIVFSNFLGLLPMAFTPTSHISVTAVMAFAVFFGVTILGFVKNGASFLINSKTHERTKGKAKNNKIYNKNFHSLNQYEQKRSDLDTITQTFQAN